jgi:hypothetical protein
MRITPALLRRIVQLPAEPLARMQSSSDIRVLPPRLYRSFSADQAKGREIGSKAEKVVVAAARRVHAFSFLPTTSLLCGNVFRVMLTARVVHPLLIALLAAPLHLSAAVTLPFGAYFRPGRCIAVDTGGASMDLSGEGIIPTHAANAGVVPVLVLGESDTTLRSSQRDAIPLRPIPANTRVVGAVDDATAGAATTLFESTPTMIVRLNPANPLPGPPIAWGALDGIVVSRAVSHDELIAWQAMGLTVATTTTPADDSVGWTKQGALWVSHPLNAGPVGSIGGDAAYQPLQAYLPLQPSALRRRILLAGVLVSLMVLAASMGRSRRSLVALAVIILAGATALETWRRAQPPFHTIGGQVIVADRTAQFDTWQYRIARAEAPLKWAAANDAWPIVVDARHAKRIELSLDCDHQKLTWRANLRQGASLAMLRRQLAAPPAQGLGTATTSPMDVLVRSFYLSTSYRPHGYTPGAQGWWPGVVLAKSP